MLTTPEESNHLPGFANRRVAVGKCARVRTSSTRGRQMGEADGGGRRGRQLFWDMRACVPDRRLNVSFQSVGFVVTGGRGSASNFNLHGVDNPGVGDCSFTVL